MKYMSLQWMVNNTKYEYVRYSTIFNITYSHINFRT